MIGSYAFSDCSFLSSLNIPNCVNSIDSFAFSSCNSLKSINYFGLIQPKCSDSAFSNVINLPAINVYSDYENDTFCGIKEINILNPEKKSKKINIGLIVGIVIACVVVVAISLFLILYFLVFKKKNINKEIVIHESNENIINELVSASEIDN